MDMFAKITPYLNIRAIGITSRENHDQETDKLCVSDYPQDTDIRRIQFDIDYEYNSGVETCSIR